MKEIINNEKFEAISELWQDKYRLELAINKHVREVNNKLNYMDSIDVSTYFKEEKDRLVYAYQKELTDLFILLSLFYAHSNEGYDELVDIRLNRFLEKASS